LPFFYLKYELTAGDVCEPSAQTLDVGAGAGKDTT
jgi:hypothetical protein